MKINLIIVTLVLCTLCGCIRLDPELLEKYQAKPVEIPQSTSESSKVESTVEVFFTEDESTDGFVDDTVSTIFTLPTELTAERLSMMDSIEDSVGWLEVPGTDIDEMVVQSTDNLYYLRKTFKGDYDFNGSYFMDHLSSINPMTKNVTLYGHNMDDNPDGIRFAQLMRYQDIDFLYENNIFKFHTKDATYTYRVIAAFYGDLEFIYWESNLSTQKFKQNLEESLKRSTVITNVPLSINDHIMTLSTCTYRYGDRQDQRWVIVGKLLQENELSAEGFIAKMNPNPLPPIFER